MSTAETYARPEIAAASTERRTDTVAIPAAIFALAFLVYSLTATGFHTFDGIAYIRDMGKPLAAMVLPHHLIYEPAILSVLNIWRALGWAGTAELPSELLSALAGAGTLAVFYKLAWELGGSRVAALCVTGLLGISYGFWFYSVEVEIYVPPLFFLIVATWLTARTARGGARALLILAGLSHGTAALIHQASLFLIPAFALGIVLIDGTWQQRLLRLLRYGLALGAVVVPAYLIAGVVVAGQTTPDAFLRWVNHYGELGTWGIWRPDSLDATVSGSSAALSSNFWTGRIVGLALLALIFARAVPISRRGGPIAWLLWAWLAIYGLFFAWWQPENLKFWVLLLPAPLLLGVLSFDWKHLAVDGRRIALAATVTALVALAVTNAPTIWTRRDPLSDPARQESAALAAMSGREDLIVLQAGSSESYLPLYYDRPNLVSARELWYTAGGAGGRGAAAQSIVQAMWHALAKGANVWIEDRVLSSGAQTSDHYVFDQTEVDRLLSPYGVRLAPEGVQAGPEVFYKFSPSHDYSQFASWDFARDQAGWSGVNVSSESVGDKGWCFEPLADPNLYGPPVDLHAREYQQLVVEITSSMYGKAQFFYRSDPSKPYNERNAVSFAVQPGQAYYTVPLQTAPGWGNVIRGMRFDPVETGATGGAAPSICIKSIGVEKPYVRHPAGPGNTK